MLTPLQRRVATLVASLAEADGFALAGGAALIVRGEVARPTRDLDFFGLSPTDVDRLAPVFERALAEDNLSFDRLQVGSGFARYVVHDGTDATEVDLASDARLFPAEPGQLSPTLSTLELAVDKVLAIFGRAEARDFVDLQSILRHHDLDELFRLAKEKDPGFLPSVFADMLRRFSRFRPDEIPLDPAGIQRLQADIVSWEKAARSLAYTQGSQDTRDLGHDQGLGI